MLDIDRLRGIYCAVVTPVSKSADGESLDEVGFRKLITHLLEGGIHGLTVLGSAGEATTLPEEQKRRAIEIAVDEVKGRIPIVVGTGNSSLHRTIEETNIAARLGADVAIVVPPFYYPLTQEGVVAYYQSLVKNTELPIILYNIPPFSKISIAPETVKTLSKIDRIIGLKDTSRDFEYLQKLLFTADRTKFRIFLGTDGLLAAGLQMGADGVIGISPNFDPRLDVELWDAFHKGDFESAVTAQKKIDKLLDVIRMGVFPAGLKATTSMLGFVSRDPWSPSTPLPESQMDIVRSKLKDLGYKI